MDNLNTFLTVYKRHLKNHLTQKSESTLHVDDLIDNSVKKIQRGDFTLNTPPLKHTCRELRIEHSFKGIKGYVNAK